jgi:hypothetical protein
MAVIVEKDSLGVDSAIIKVKETVVTKKHNIHYLLIQDLLMQDLLIQDLMIQNVESKTLNFFI